MLKLRKIDQEIFLIISITYNNRFMISYRNPMPNKSYDMTNINFHTNFRLLIRCAFIFKKKASKASI